MDLKALKYQILGGYVARRVLLRALMLAMALSIIPLVQVLTGSDPILLDSLNNHRCDLPFTFTGNVLLKNRFLKPIWATFECKNDVNLTTDVAMKLMGMQLLDYSGKGLCVGEGSASAVYALRELGLSNVCGAYRHPFFSLKQRKLVYELEYADNSFDFVYSRDLDRVSVPALLVFEIERVLKPGGIGAMLVTANSLDANGLIRSATPISSLLKTSTILHVDYVHEFTLVVFKKRFVNGGYFEQFRLPGDCPSVMNNRPYMGYMEPLVDNKQIGFEEKIAYLPKYVDKLPKKQRAVYVEIGAGEDLNFSAANWFLPSYPVDHKAFDVYFVHHNASVLLSCIRRPGVTFIYHPGLAGDKVAPSLDADDLDPYVHDEEFDFLAWFKGTVQDADFVVLKMKAGEMELAFLSDLFKTETICHVDELFLSCSDDADGNGKGLVSADCMDLFKSLRASGVYVHQWWED